MRYSQILEKVQDDLDQHKAVSDAVSKLSQYFYDETNSANDYGMKWADVNFGDPETNGTYFILPAKQAGLTEFPDLMFLFGKAKIRHTTGMNARSTKPILGHTKLILIWCARTDADPNTMLAQIKAKVVGNFETHHVLKHELTHYLDFQRRAVANKEDTFAKGYEHYYNNPSEYNAYFTNLADHLMGMINGMRREPDHAQTYADLYDYDPDFMTMLKDIMTASAFEGLRGFLKYMNTKTRQKTLKRLYALHQYAGELLAKAH